jgi:hypothetical protein
MTTVSVEIEIDAPAQTTWEVVTDWERQGEWMPVTHVEVTGSVPAGVGAELAARSGLGPVGFVDRMVVDVWEPPYRCEVVHLGRVVTGRGVFLVEDLPGNRSRFTWREELAGSGVRRVVDRLGSPGTRLFLGVAARRLARLVAREAG